MTALAVVLVVCAGQLDACTIFPPSYHVHGTFQVRVTDRVGRAMSQIEVGLDSNEGVRYGAITDERGGATFVGIQPGSYSITKQPRHASWAYIEVVSEQEKKDVKEAISITWPDGNVLRTRRLQGSLVPPPPESSTLRLVDARSQKNLEEKNVATGSFDFATSAPGLYMLTLSPRANENKDSWVPAGDIFVEVTPEALDRPLEVGIGMTSCGLMYSNVCRPPDPIPVAAVCGRLEDPQGAAIAGARITLLEDSSQIAHGTSNQDGDFDLRKVPSGTYELQIDVVGFTPSRAHVVVPSDASCGKKRMVVPLPVLGSTDCTWGKASN